MGKEIKKVTFQVVLERVRYKMDGAMDYYVIRDLLERLCYPDVSPERFIELVEFQRLYKLPWQRFVTAFQKCAVSIIKKEVDKIIGTDDMFDEGV